MLRASLSETTGWEGTCGGLVKLSSSDWSVSSASTVLLALLNAGLNTGHI